MASGYFRFTTAVLLIATCLLLIAVVDSAETITTCDYSDLQVHRLYCDHGVIKVQHALYGRSSSLVCADDKPQNYLANTHCTQPNTANRIKKSCNGKKLCELSLEDFRKPEPCADTFKYLQTNFTCLPAITVVTCEGSVAQLHCGKIYPQFLTFVSCAPFFVMAFVGPITPARFRPSDLHLWRRLRTPRPDHMFIQKGIL
ncbi:L-rhamnose-binding lectin SML-like isoform 3-T3 [Syngnathus typhle]